MLSKKNKPKQDPAQLAGQLKREKEEKRRGQVIREGLYPLLVAHTKSVADAKVFLQTMDLVVEQSFMNLKGEMKVSELKIDENMKNSEEALRYKAFYDLIAGESLAAAKDIMSSMGNIISNNLRQEESERKLDDLPLKFITYENDK